MLDPAAPRSRPPAPRGAPRPAAAQHAFDDHHPPDPRLIADCVHCGFCLPACPTYQLWGEEMDSPRGRILLMDLAAGGERPLSSEMVAHFDSCLGCLACVPACPSGVAYDRLLESTRQQVERRYRRPLKDRLWRKAVFTVLPHPTVMRLGALSMWAVQRVRPGSLDLLPGRAAAAAALLPSGGPARSLLRRLPAPRPARGNTRLRVGLLGGCVQRVVFPLVNEASALALAAYGAEVRIPPGQGCCGALEYHAGREAAALRRARRLVAQFEDPQLDRIAVNAAGCGALLSELGRLLEEDSKWGPRAAAVAAKVRDVTEVLDELGPPPGLHPLPLRVAYHDACHLIHAQGVREEPRRVLRAIPELQLVEIAESDLCCGSAGTYNLTEVEAAHDLGRRKAQQVAAASAQVLTAGNPGCLLQIQAALRESGIELPALHPVQLVAASLLGQGPEEAILRS